MRLTREQRAKAELLVNAFLAGMSGAIFVDIVRQTALLLYHASQV